MGMRGNTIVGFGGLGNRVNEIINGLTVFRDGDLLWHINEHMPHPFEQIFDSNFNLNIKNVQEGDPEYIRNDQYWANLYSEETYCSYWYVGESVLQRKPTQTQLIKLYVEVLGNLKSYEDCSVYSIAAHWRGMGTSTGTVEDFLENLIQLWNTKADNKYPIFVLADSNRNIIEEKLKNEDIPYTMCMSPEMTHDKDRDSLGGMRSFISDYLTLNKCPLILTSSCMSTITDPARMLGSDVYHIGPTRTDPCDWSVANKPNSYKKL